MPNHAHPVSVWLEAATNGSVPLAASFERTFAALWRRAGVTLGDVTLGAIGCRVLSTASERFPFLQGIDSSTLSAMPPGKLEDAAKGVSQDEQARAFSFLLVEFLDIVGNLTADILTPALHEELARAFEGPDPERPRKGNKGPRP